MLEAATRAEVDAVWIGRDLGYRGGRRTGLALTDDVHLADHGGRWGVATPRPTRGNPIAERTAAVIWRALLQIGAPIFLWNVFPLHPHEPNEPFTNRAHNVRERRAGEDLLVELVHMLKPRRLVALGNHAAKVATRICETQEVVLVRHPSYGGLRQFEQQISQLYPQAAQGSQLRLV
jgi:hypothetical protein